MTNSLSPEEAFALAAREFDDGDARPGLLAMAEAQADGDAARTRAAYLRLRAAQLGGAPPAGARPAAPMAAPPPPPPSEAKKTGVAVAVAALVFISLAALAFLFFGSAGEAESEVQDDPAEEAVPVAEPIIVTIDCASTRRRVGGGSPGELLGSAVGSLLDDAGLEATVTVRNAGAAGEVVVAVAAYSEVQPGALGREQTIALAAGERRQLSFTFDPTPFSRGGACRAWAAPLGDPLSDFDAFVQTYDTRPAPEAAPAPPEPEARPAPDLQAEPVVDPPAPDAPPPVSDPIPRTPQPERDPAPDAEPVPDDDVSLGDGT